MHSFINQVWTLSAIVAGAALLCIAAPTAQAQFWQRHNQWPHCEPQPVCPPARLLPPQYVTPPAHLPPDTKKDKTTDPKKTETTEPKQTQDVSAQAPFTPSFAPTPGGGEAGLGGLASRSGGPGYIDSAIPSTQFRLRYDSAYGNNRPDRAEFFYAKCGCFGGNAQGPPRPETGVDYQDIAAYVEVAVTPNFSGFFEAPIRFLNPDANDNTTGLGNVKTGFKYAFYNCPEYGVATALFRVSFPTGDSDRGLGNDLTSFEPSLLYFAPLTDRTFLNAQVGLWIPSGGSEFAGEVLYYGVAVSHTLIDDCTFRVAPVGEILAWNVLDGKQFSVQEGLQDADGDTIVNLKVGVRMGFGCVEQPGTFGQTELYVGYGHAVTKDVWYREILRVEFIRRF